MRARVDALEKFVQRMREEVAELGIYAKGDVRRPNLRGSMAGLVRQPMRSKWSDFNIDAPSNSQHPDNMVVPPACHFSASSGDSLFLANIETVQPTFVPLNERENTRECKNSDKRISKIESQSSAAQGDQPELNISTGFQTSRSFKASLNISDKSHYNILNFLGSRRSLSPEMYPQTRVTAAILEHLQMKLGPSSSEVYNVDAGPHRKSLWDMQRRKELESKLLKNMGTLIAELERDVVTQNQKMRKIQEEIIAKRASKGKMASVREVVMGKLHRQTSAITLSNMALEMRVMAFQKSLEMKEFERSLQVEVTRAKEKTTQAIKIQNEYTTKLLTQITAAEKHWGVLFLQNKTGLRRAYQTLINLVDNLQCRDECSNMSGEITMEVTLRHNAIEKMIHQIENEIDQELKEKEDSAAVALEIHHVNQVLMLMDQAESNAAIWEGLQHEVSKKSKIEGSFAENVCKKAKMPIFQQTKREREKVRYYRTKLFRRQEIIIRLNKTLLEKERELNILQEKAIESKGKGYTWAQSQLSVMKATQKRVHELICKMREDGKEWSNLKSSIENFDIRIRKLQGKINTERGSQNVSVFGAP